MSVTLQPDVTLQHTWGSMSSAGSSRRTCTQARQRVDSSSHKGCRIPKSHYAVVQPFISMAGGRDASSDGDTDESDGLQQEGPSGNGYCPGQWCSQSDMRAVRHAVRTMDSCSSPSAVTWFPEYGCALVALGPHGAAALCDGGTSDGGAGSVPDSMAVPEGVPPPGTAPAAAPGAAAAGADTLSLQLVGLDEWCFRVHSCHAYGQMVTAG